IGELAASVFQDPRSQFFTVNSSNEVAFGLENHGLPQDKIRRRVEEAFRIFHLERLKDRNVYELSSGERQLISILSAWAMDTDIFLLDEPTANLDFAATQQLKEILLALKKQGKTLLLSEHRLYYLADIADEFWVMADGEIKGKYTAAEAKAFSVERRQTLSLRTLDLAEITVPEKEPLPKTAPTALAVSDVCYTYGRKAGDTLSGVSFSVRDRKSTRLNSSHVSISYAVFCLKKKKTKTLTTIIHAPILKPGIVIPSRASLLSGGLNKSLKNIFTN